MICSQRSVGFARERAIDAIVGSQKGKRGDGGAGSPSIDRIMMDCGIDGAVTLESLSMSISWTSSLCMCMCIDIGMSTQYVHVFLISSPWGKSRGKPGYARTKDGVLVCLFRGRTFGFDNSCPPCASSPLLRKKTLYFHLKCMIPTFLTLLRPSLVIPALPVRLATESAEMFTDTSTSPFAICQGSTHGQLAWFRHSDERP